MSRRTMLEFMIAVNTGGLIAGSMMAGVLFAQENYEQAIPMAVLSLANGLLAGQAKKRKDELPKDQ